MLQLPARRRGCTLVPRFSGCTSSLILWSPNFIMPGVPDAIVNRFLMLLVGSFGRSCGIPCDSVHTVCLQRGWPDPGVKTCAQLYWVHIVASSYAFVDHSDHSKEFQTLLGRAKRQGTMAGTMLR